MFVLTQVLGTCTEACSMHACHWHSVLLRSGMSAQLLRTKYLDVASRHTLGKAPSRLTMSRAHDADSMRRCE